MGRINRLLTNEAANERKLSTEKCVAIFRVLTINKDVAELLEAKGVEYRDIETIFDLALCQLGNLKACGC